MKQNKGYTLSEGANKPTDIGAIADNMVANDLNPLKGLAESCKQPPLNIGANGFISVVSADKKVSVGENDVAGNIRVTSSAGHPGPANVVVVGSDDRVSLTTAAGNTVTPTIAPNMANAIRQAAGVAVCGDFDPAAKLVNDMAKQADATKGAGR